MKNNHAAVTLDLPLSDALYLARAGVAAVSKDDFTPVVTGVLVSASEGFVRVLSTDRYRVHRASVAPEGSVPTVEPFLVPAKALRWFIANASYFGRGLVPPVARWVFEPTEQRPELKSTSGTPTPGGLVTLAIRETDDAGVLSLRTEMIAGIYPSRVSELIDDALASKSVADDSGTLDLDLLAGSRALAGYRGERPKVRFVSNGTKAQGQALVVYRSGVALIQKGSEQ